MMELSPVLLLSRERGAAGRHAVCRAVVFLIAIVGLAARSIAVESIPTGSALATFEQTAADVFLRRCVECHAGSEAEGGLDLTTADPVTSDWI